MLKLNQSKIRNPESAIESSHQTRSILAMLAAASLWSTSGLLVKVIAINAVPLAGWRSAIAGLTLWLIARALHIRIGIPADATSWLAVICYGAILFLFIAATKITTAANVIFLQYTAPIYVLVFEPVFLGTRFRLRDLFFVFLALLGMSLFFVGRADLGDWRGNTMALASGMAFAAFALLVRRRHSDDTARWQAVVWGNLVLFGLTFLFLLLHPAPRMFPASLQESLGVLFLGVIQIGLAYAFFSYAISHLFALEATLIAMLEPVLNPVWVYLGTGEAPSRWAIFGGALIIGAVSCRTAMELRRQNL